MVTGYHGTRSTHIEQVAARLNWPCVRVASTAISRIDLVGGTDRHQGGQAGHGIPRRHLAWALQHNIALVFDEYDAGRPDVMFVIQRVLKLRPPDPAPTRIR
jgi:cobaltochelatase CobS